MLDRLRDDRVDLDRYSDWGIYENPWHISTRLRILLVIDGMIDDPWEPLPDFKTRLFVEALHDTSFAWWCALRWMSRAQVEGRRRQRARTRIQPGRSSTEV